MRELHTTRVVNGHLRNKRAEWKSHYKC